MTIPSGFLARVILGTIFGAAVAHGATITVFSNADTGAGTLRQAIFDASPGDTINFAIPVLWCSSRDTSLKRTVDQ
jgi:hypothetical protein